MDRYAGADRAVDPPSSSGPAARSASWRQDCGMEHLAGPRLPDQGLEVGETENAAGVTAAKPFSGEPGLETLENYN